RAARGFDSLRAALRALRASPGFTIAALATLAIGIGPTTAIFSVVDGVLLKPLPFSRPDRVVALFQDDRKSGNVHDDVAPANFVDWRARTTSFAAMASAEPFALTYTGPDGVEQIYNWNVTQDFFSILDARPALGRLFVPGDFVPGPPRVLVLTYASWQRRFGGDPDIIGKQLRIGSGSATVIGVLPRNFDYLESSKMEVYAPTVFGSWEKQIRNTAWHHVVGRLKPGVSLDAARADAARIGAQLSSEYPATNANIGVTVEPLDHAIVGDARRAVLLLLGAVSLVLLIACVNVASLVITRTARRSRELAIRTALGASRARIAGEMLIEHLLIASAGGALGAGLAAWSVGIIRRVSPVSVPRVADMRVDARALGFTLAVVALATIVFGLVPALRGAQPNAVVELRSGDRSAGSASRRRPRQLLVVAEVALAVILLVGSGLLMRSFVSVVGADRGYKSDHVLAATVFIYQWNPTPASQVNFISQLLSRTAAIPGVVAAGATSSLPLDIAIGADRGTFTIDGRPVPLGGEPSAHMTTITPGTLRALRIPVHRGRSFSARDDSASAPVVIINDAMARRYWPGADPVGRRIRFAFYSKPLEREVVGVVADTKQTALDAPGEPILYVPLAQAPTGAMAIVLRTANVDPRSVLGALKRTVAELNPALPLAGVETLDELADASVQSRRFTLSLLATFAACALVLGLVGTYAVVGQGVTERRRELGVRLALGAQAGDVIRLMMQDGLVPAAAGVALGLAGGAAVTGLLRRMLVGVEPFDTATFAGVALLMLAGAAVACFVPARRATVVSPLDTLRAPGG
ncbi:MAG TPA: ABC transporter permease, partial [Gemmatimonadaceae bacterium]|nr:ABC transporter permease [Gemmatimonadaceae bacterium]